MPRRRKKKGNGIPWLNIFIGGAIAALVAVVVAIFGVLGWVKSYLAGGEFREIVSREVSEEFKAKGAFEEIHWTDSSAYSDGYEARGYADAPFSRITANGVRADVDFGAVREGAWRVTGIEVNRLVLLINDADRLAGMAADHVALPAPVDKEEGVLERFLPKTVEVDGVAVANASLVAERVDGSRIRLSDTAAKLRPIKGSEAWSVSGRGGSLVLPGLPGLEIDSFATRLVGPELFITDAAFTCFDGARVSGAGEMEFGGDSRLELQLKVADLDTDEVVGPQWREKVTGTVHGDARVERLENGDVRKKGRAEVTNGVLEDMKVLDMVADYAKAERFRRLVLHEAHADFEHVGERLEITNLVLQSDGLTRLTGDMVIENGMIEGNFRVGVTPGTLKWIPGAERKVFVEPADGFLWTSMRVEGPVENPREDLSARLKVAAVKAVVEGAVNGVLKAAPDGAVEAGKSAADASVEAGKTAVDAGRSAIDAAAEGGKKILETFTPFLR